MAEVADSVLTTVTRGSGDTAAATDYQSLALQSHFSRRLIESLRKVIVLDQFASRHPLPPKSGSTTMRMFRFPDGAATNISTLAEGTAPTVNHMDIEKIDVTLDQYGEVVGISDLADATELFDLGSQAVTRMGFDTGYHFDSVIRAELLTNTTGVNDVFAGQPDYGDDTTAISMTDVLDATTALKIDNAAEYDGGYPCVIGPQVWRDIQQDPDWLAANQRANNAENIFKGECGQYAGIRFVLTTEPGQVDGSGSQYTYNSSGGTYVCFVLGRDSYGVADLASQSPYSPSVIINDGPDKSDPLNQVIKIGCKSFFGVEYLQPTHAARIYCKTNYS